MDSVHTNSTRLRRPLAVVAAACVVPYAGLLTYLLYAHRSSVEVHRPEGIYLTVLAVLGGVVPLVVSALVFSRLVRDASRFRPWLLVELYAGLLIVFASLYSVAQSASYDAAFVGAPTLWGDDAVHSLSGHVERLHGVFGTMLYMSIVTMTTVGYGDIVPVSAPARILTALQALCGVSFVSISVGHYFAVCTHRR